MTTYHPPPEVPPTVEVQDPYPNKAVAAAVTTVVTVAVQWVASGELGLQQEGLTALGGAVATLLVYFVSNWKRRGK